MEKAEIKAKKIPWIWIILMVVVVAALNQVRYAFVPGWWASRYNMTGWHHLAWAQGAAMLVALTALFYLIPPLAKRGINTETLVYIFTGGTAALLMSADVPFGVGSAMFTSLISGIVYSPLHAQYMPWWMPKKEVLEPMLLGHASVPWGEWIIPAFWWCGIGLVMFLFLGSACAIFRRRWIEIERIPYPFGLQAYYVTASTVTPEAKTKGEARMSPLQVFLIGLVVGCVIYVPVLLNLMIPWIPDIYGWTNPTRFTIWGVPGGAVMPANFPALSRMIVGLTNIQTNPIWFNLFFLAPLDMLFSYWFFWFAIVIVGVQIAFVMGYYPGMDTADIWTRPGLIASNPPFNLVSLGMVGAMSGVLFFTIVFSRGYFGATIKHAIYGKDETVKSWEKDEVMSYRNMYILFVLATILHVVLYMSLGMSVAIALLWTGVVAMNTLAIARCHGQLGFTAHWPYYYNAWWRPVWPIAPAQPSTEFFVINDMGGWFTSGQGAPIQDTALYTMDNFAFGFRAGAPARNIWKVYLVSIILAPLISYPIGLSILYHFGIQPLGKGMEWDMFTLGDPENYNVNTPGTGPWAYWAVLGFILSGVLIFLRMRFAWWPLDPVGLVFVSSPWQLMFGGLYFAAFGAWVVKFLVIRLGGAKFYEQYALPFNVGMSAGWLMVIMFIGQIVAPFKYFYP